MENMTTVRFDVPVELADLLSRSSQNQFERNAMLILPFVRNLTVSHGRAAEILGVRKLELIAFYGKLGLPWTELREWVHIAPPEAPAETPAAAGSPFAGKTVVVTGKVEPYTRGEMNSFIASLGAVAGSFVTSKTNYLVCEDKAGSKLDKARSLGILMLTPDEFFAMAQAS